MAEGILSPRLFSKINNSLVKFLSLVDSGTVTVGTTAIGGAYLDTVELDQSYDIVIPILCDTTKGNAWYQTRTWNNNKSITFASSTSGDTAIYKIYAVNLPK